jgi:DNA-directed RNA polymerase subunit beta'
LISEILPKNIPFSFIDQDLNKKAISKLFDVSYRVAGLKEIVIFADKIKNMGFK